MEPYWPNREVLSAGQNALIKHAPSKKLLEYLKKFQGDSLTTGSPEGLPNYAKQRDILINLMRQQYELGQGYHQTLGGRVMNLPKFWELMLSMDFVSHEIELTNNIGYDESEAAPGLRSTVESPYAEFTIVDENLKQAVATKAENAVREADVFMRGSNVCVAITDEKTYSIAKLDEHGPYHKFMNYLLEADNTGISISLDEVRSIKGLKTTKDLTELARYCGFNKILKEAFFIKSKQGKIHFNSHAKLNIAQIEAVKKQALKLSAKNRK